MKRTIIIFLSLISLIAQAQEPQIIGGYLLDGKDSFEELEAAVLTESRSKDKNLGGKGMKFPGGSIFIFLVLWTLLVIHIFQLVLTLGFQS